MTATLLSVFQWALVLPMAVAAAFLIDGLVVTLLARVGVGDQTTPWVLGKLAGHIAMGAAAVATGIWLAPAHKRPTAWVLLAFIAAIPAESVFTSGLRLALIGPLAAAFVGGAALPTLRHRLRQPQ